MKFLIAALLVVTPLTSMAAPVFFKCEGSEEKTSEKAASEIALDESNNSLTFQQISGGLYKPGLIKKITPTLTSNELIGVLENDVRPVLLVYKFSIDRANLDFVLTIQMGLDNFQRYVGRCTILKKQNLF